MFYRWFFAAGERRHFPNSIHRNNLTQLYRALKFHKMSSIPILKNFIDGKFVDVVCDSYAEVVDPAKGETLAQVPKSSVKDLNEAVDAAKVTIL